jgi:hypothetical protein
MVPTVPMVPRASKASLDRLMPRPELRKAGPRFPWQAPARGAGPSLSMVPPSARTSLCALGRRRELWEEGSRLPHWRPPDRSGQPGGDGPDAAGETSNASADVVLGACLGATPGSIGFGSPRLLLNRLWSSPLPAQPVVRRARRRGGRRAVVAVVVPAARRSRLSDPFGNPERNAGGICVHGNNCWRCSRVFFVCV